MLKFEKIVVFFPVLVEKIFFQIFNRFESLWRNWSTKTIRVHKEWYGFALARVVGGGGGKGNHGSGVKGSCVAKGSEIARRQLFIGWWVGLVKKRIEKEGTLLLITWCLLIVGESEKLFLFKIKGF
jgi:hypothetical protein